MPPSAAPGGILIDVMLGVLWLNIVWSDFTLIHAHQGAEVGLAIGVTVVALGITIGLLRGIRWVRWAAIAWFSFAGVRVVWWAVATWPELRAAGVSQFHFAAMILTGVGYLLAPVALWWAPSVAAFEAQARTRRGLGRAPA